MSAQCTLKTGPTSPESGHLNHSSWEIALDATADAIELHNESSVIISIDNLL